MPTSDSHFTTKGLETYGFTILENVLSPEECKNIGSILDEIENCIGKGKNIAAVQTESLIQLLNVHYQKPDELMRYINKKPVMEVISSILKDEYCLSNFNASRPIYNASNLSRKMRIHIDSRQPCADVRNTSQVVAMYCIDEFTKDNGATVVVPMSHHSGIDPRYVENSDHYAIPVEAPAGSVIFILGHTWHDIGNMIQNSRRWGIISYYSKWWIKPTYDFIKSCNDEIYSTLSSEQKKLLGFASCPPYKFHLRQKTNIKEELLPTSFKDYLKEAN